MFFRIFFQYQFPIRLKKPEEETANKNNENNDSNFYNPSLEEFKNIQINAEINIDSNNNNNNIEKEKINDDSIETIPINDEKKITNIGFRKILKNY